MYAIENLSIYELLELSKCGELQTPTEAESLVMFALWRVNEPVTSATLLIIVNAVYRKNKSGWKIQTLTTLLSRLEYKGYVYQKRDGRKYLWKNTISKKLYREWMTLKLLDDYYSDISELQTTLSKLEIEFEHKTAYGYKKSGFPFLEKIR